MILIKSNTSNNVALYNSFKSYIDKYITSSHDEEWIRNYSYRQIAILKLYCAFNLVNTVYKQSLLTDINNTPLYTIDKIFENYQIYKVGAELQKINININDIFNIFFNNTITIDLLSYKNKHNSISRLDKITTVTDQIIDYQDNTNEVSTVPIDIYKGTTRNLTMLVGYINEPRPIIASEWTLFTLSIKQNGTTLVNYWWNNTNTPVDEQYAATISNIAGQIIFQVTPTILNLLAVGLCDLRLFFTQTDSQTDIFDQIGALNILE